YAPDQLSIDADGSIYIEDYSHWRVRKVDANGMISTVAGDGRNGEPGARNVLDLECPGNLATRSTMEGPFPFSDSHGGIYIDVTGYNQVIHSDSDEFMEWLANRDGSLVYAFFGDGGPAINALFNTPSFLPVDSRGVLYIDV